VDPPSPQLFLAHAFVLCALVTLTVAAVVLRFHNWNLRRLSRIREDATALALEFTRYLSGGCSETALRNIAGAAPHRVLWEALERFSDNVGGEEWALLSDELRGLPGVTCEIDMLAHRVGWRRALAAHHLGLIDVPGASQSLLVAMRRGPAEVTLAAALSLARMGDLAALVALLEHPELTAGCGRYQLVALLKRFGSEANDELRRVLAIGDIDSPIHVAAVEILGIRRDRRSRRKLEDLLLARSPETRIVATRALGRVGSSRSVPALRDALGDPVWQVRAQAARALGEIGASSVAPQLAVSLRDPAWWVRRNAAYALAGFGQAGHEVLAATATDSEDRYARDMAREALQALDWERESPGGITRVA
jgi:HEAT repeat protein